MSLKSFSRSGSSKVHLNRCHEGVFAANVQGVSLQGNTSDRTSIAGAMKPNHNQAAVL